MKYIKKFNEDLHLNPFQMGKTKWEMPKGLSMYTKDERSYNRSEFKIEWGNFMNKNLEKYFPGIHSEMKIVDYPFHLPLTKIEREFSYRDNDYNLPILYYEVND